MAEGIESEEEKEDSNREEDSRAKDAAVTNAEKSRGKYSC